MYKVIATFTRPSVDIPFYTPTKDEADHNIRNYGFIRQRTLSEDGLVMTFTTLAENEEIYQQSIRDREEGNNEGFVNANRYNEENGIVREVIFKGTIE